MSVNVKRRVHYQYKKLAEEFDNFIQNKGLNVYKPFQLVPLKMPDPRESLNRQAKDSITYVGLEATDPVPKKKRKGKKPNVESDEEVEWGADEYSNDKQDLVILNII